LRFAQAGMAAEVYAGSPDELSRVLRHAPGSPALPIVHLDRKIDIRNEVGRALVQQFRAMFAGRVSGLVVHDKSGMAANLSELLTALRMLGNERAQPTVYLEYAAGMDLGAFYEIGEGIRDVQGVSLCIDTGHVGIRRAHARFALLHPDIHLSDLSAGHPRLPDLVSDVQDAVRSALPALLDLIQATSALGKTVHYHLHDGHPLIPGLSDHRSFLNRLAIPFRYEGRYSLDPLYGPDGLAHVLRAATTGAHVPSFTLEIHQADGRQPLGAAAELFTHWRDRTNAERMNHWLSILADNHVLAVTALSRSTAP
jgi:hypothetical protein